MNSGVSNFIMIVETSDIIHRYSPEQLSIFSQKMHNSIEKSLEKHNAKILENDDTRYVVLFATATDAVLCSLKMHHKFRYTSPKINRKFQELKIVITQFDELSYAKRFGSFLCDSVQFNIVTTQSVERRYNTENNNLKIDKERIYILNEDELNFLRKLEAFLNQVWCSPDLSMTTLEHNLEAPYSQIYSKIKKLIGKSPSIFIRDYRLKKSLKYLRDKNESIKMVAQNMGFNSNSYFSTSFKSRFGMTPQEYSRLEI